MARHFLIERYAREQWPQITGSLPWVIRGPNFERGYEIAYDFDVLPPDRMMRRVIAEELLYEGVLTTAWVVTGNIPDVLPIGDTLEKSIGQLTLAIPTLGPGETWSDSVMWLMELIGQLHDYISYVSEDGLKVVQMSTPTRPSEEPSEGDAGGGMVGPSEQTARSPEPSKENV